MRMRKTAAAVDFPADTTEDILKWLPVKSLMRFRRVSPSWRALIDSDYFTGLHADTRRNIRRHLTVFWPPQFVVEVNMKPHRRLWYVDPYNDGKGKAKGENCSNELDMMPLMKQNIDLDDEGCSNLRLKLTMCPCQGLTLMVTNAYIRVMDLVRKDMITLPNSSALIKDVGFPDQSASIGYNDTTGEYEIVRLLSEAGPSFTCEIYTLGSNGGLWKKSNPPPYNRVDMRNPPVFTQGRHHWLVRPCPSPTMFVFDEEYKRMLPICDCPIILAFNKEKEKYDMMFVRQYEMARLEPASMFMDANTGNLCLLLEMYDTDCRSPLCLAEIWMLVDYVKGLWERRWMGQLPSRIRYHIIWMEGREILYKTRLIDGVGWYHLDCHEVRTLAKACLVDAGSHSEGDAVGVSHLCESVLALPDLATLSTENHVLTPASLFAKERELCTAASNRVSSLLSREREFFIDASNRGSRRISKRKLLEDPEMKMLFMNP